MSETTTTTTADVPVKKRKPRSPVSARIAKMSADKFQKMLDKHAAEGTVLKAEVARRNAAKAFVYQADQG